MLTLIGHRGAPAEFTENTLASLSRAESLGADAVEFDVRITRDGVPVLLHDEDLLRLWGRRQRLVDVDYANVADILPTLADVVDALSIRLAVDCKGAGTVERAVEVLRSRGALPRCVFVGEDDVLRDVRAELPEARIALSWRGDTVPTEEVLGAVRPAIMNLRWSDLDTTRLAWYRSRGLELWTFTVDDAAAFDKAIQLGFDGVITNNLAPLVTARASTQAAS